MSSNLETTRRGELVERLRSKSSFLFHVAQCCWWVVKAARQNAFATLAVGSAAIAGAVGPILYPLGLTFQVLLWSLAAACTVILLVGAIVAIVREVVSRMTAGHEKVLSDLRHELDAARSRMLTQIRELKGEVERTDHSAAAGIAAISGDLRSSLEEFRRDIEPMQKALSGVDTALAEVRTFFAGQVSQTKDALVRQLDDAANRSVSMDLVAALRPLLRSKEAATLASQGRVVEHGHGLLMSILAEEERNTPGALAGRTLIEIGTTRERIATQGSTAKLAIFTGLTGMRFVTVDMDPINTKRANAIICFLNPAATAVAQRGETYLAEHLQPQDIVYLDAFDFDHSKHSELRRSRYKDILQTDITDAACWKMHLDCAVAIAGKLAPGGLVVIDDTWIEDGRYVGKGKLAVPYLEQNGFAVTTRFGTAVALRRMS